MDSWFETFCQELVLRDVLAPGDTALVLAREDFGLVLRPGEDWSQVPATALVEGLAPRWTAWVRRAVMPLLERDPATGEEWAAGAAAGYRSRPDAQANVVTDVLVIDLVDQARGGGQWVVPHEVTDRGASFAEAVRAGECAPAVLLLGEREPRDPGRIPAPDGTGNLPRARGRLVLDLGGARLGVERVVNSGGHGFAYASEPYASTLQEAGIAPVELVVLDL